MTKRLNKFSCILVLNTLAFVLLAMLLPIHFETNDDVAMCWIANGVITGTPDEHLVFIHALYGLVLKVLYSHIGWAEWYSVLFSMCHIVSVSVIVSKIIKTEGPRCIKASVVSLVYAFWLVFIVFFQFTTTAALLTIAGICLLHDKKYISAFGLLFVASLIRFNVVGLLGLFYAPVVVGRWLESRSHREPLYCLLIAISLLGIHEANRLFYQSKEWKDYTSYNIIRGKVQDSSHHAHLLSQKPPKGLTENDIRRTIGFNQDPNIITEERLNEINALQTSGSAAEKAINIYKGFLKVYYIPNTLLLLILLGTLLKIDDRKKRMVILCGIVLWFVILAYIAFNTQLKQRVFLPSVFLMALYALFYIAKKKSIHDYYIAGALFLLSMACTYRAANRCIANNRNVQAVLVEQLAAIKKAQPNRMVTLHRSFSSYLLNPFEMRSYFSPKSYICRGWMTHFPGAAGLDSDLDMLEDNLCFIATKEDDMQTYIISLQEHYNKEVEVVEIDTTEHYKICKLREVNDQNK